MLCLSAVQGIVHTPERFPTGSTVWKTRQENAKKAGAVAFKKFQKKAQDYEDKLRKEGKSLDLRKNKTPVEGTNL